MMMLNEPTFQSSWDEDLVRVWMENVPDTAIFRLDPHGKVERWNVGAERLRGFALLLRDRTEWKSRKTPMSLSRRGRF